MERGCLIYLVSAFGSGEDHKSFIRLFYHTEQLAPLEALYVALKYENRSLIPYFLKNANSISKGFLSFMLSFAAEFGYLKIVKTIIFLNNLTIFKDGLKDELKYGQCDATIDNNYAIRLAIVGEHFDVVKYVKLPSRYICTRATYV